MEILEDRVAIVTGGASGMGRAIAVEFARHGAKAVIIADLRREPREGGETTEALIRRTSSTESVFVHCDVESYGDLEKLATASADRGGADILVNNAGIYWVKSLFDETEDSFTRMMNVNVRGPFLLSQIVARQMIAKKVGGAIINLGSTSSLRSSPGFTAYAASKAAILSLTYSLAAELGPYDIRVNAILPGRIKTAMTMKDVPTIDAATGASDTTRIALGRYGDPKNIADACVFFASSMSDFVTASALVVDGGSANTSIVRLLNEKDEDR